LKRSFPPPLPHSGLTLENRRARVEDSSVKSIQEETKMKSLLSLMVLASATAFAAPAFADPKPPATEAECNKTEGYDWDAATGKCIAEDHGG
jgi:hypothetical protein